MKDINIENENVILHLSKDELGALINALNEVCNGFEVKKFEKKIGVSEEKATILLKFLSSIYRKANFERFHYM